MHSSTFVDACAHQPTSTYEPSQQHQGSRDEIARLLSLVSRNSNKRPTEKAKATALCRSNYASQDLALPLPAPVRFVRRLNLKINGEKTLPALPSKNSNKLM
jgi:hypothetical protein